MAIDIDVIPTTQHACIWGDLKQQIRHSAEECDTDEQEANSLSLNEMGSHCLLLERDRLSIPGYYYFSSSSPCTLSLSVDCFGDDVDISEYVTDYGRDLPTGSQDSIVSQWRLSRFAYGLSSGGGRPQNELRRLFWIAGCLAALSAGYCVIKDNDVFPLRLGIYVPDKLRQAAMNAKNWTRV